MSPKQVVELKCRAKNMRKVPIFPTSCLVQITFTVKDGETVLFFLSLWMICLKN